MPEFNSALPIQIIFFVIITYHYLHIKKQDDIIMTCIVHVVVDVIFQDMPYNSENIVLCKYILTLVIFYFLC
jgi:hypothetical protein